jgi:hypothetical protein
MMFIYIMVVQTLLIQMDLFSLIYRYIAFMSGLNFGEETQDCLQLQMFIDLLTGQLGSIQVLI